MEVKNNNTIYCIDCKRIKELEKKRKENGGIQLDRDFGIYQYGYITKNKYCKECAKEVLKEQWRKASKKYYSHKIENS